MTVNIQFASSGPVTYVVQFPCAPLWLQQPYLFGICKQCTTCLCDYCRTCRSFWKGFIPYYASLPYRLYNLIDGIIKLDDSSRTISPFMMKQTDAYTENLFENAIEKRICPQTKGTFMPLPSICRGTGQASERRDRWWSYQGRSGAMEGFRGRPESLLFGQIVRYSLQGSWHFYTRCWETWALSSMHKCKELENDIQYRHCFSALCLRGCKVVN